MHIPHPIPYQGSTRKLASAICRYVPESIDTLYEPFAGSAAVSLYMAGHGLARRFVMGDSLEPIVRLWKLIVNRPSYVSRQYSLLWQGQRKGDDRYFNRIRDDFNENGDPVQLLYLTARCVKNAIRFNRDGKMTQSVDKRRRGMSPEKMEANIFASSRLLKGKVGFFCGDFADCIRRAGESDMVYMDPPYQGTTYGRDKRYFEQVSYERLCEALGDLIQRGVYFLLSYDGSCGEVQYGRALPDDLNLKRILLNAGRSTQATLNGKDAITIESLYMPGCSNRRTGPTVRRRRQQAVLFR